MDVFQISAKKQESSFSDESSSVAEVVEKPNGEKHPAVNGSFDKELKNKISDLEKVRPSESIDMSVRGLVAPHDSFLLLHRLISTLTFRFFGHNEPSGERASSLGLEGFQQLYAAFVERLPFQSQV